MLYILFYASVEAKQVAKIQKKYDSIIIFFLSFVLKDNFLYYNH
jgi:hypothetical protein